MDNNSYDRANRFGELLKPNATKERLLAISLYISLFEYFKDMIIDDVKYFWVEGISDGKLVISTKYKEEVLSRDKSVLYASLKWLKDIEAIKDEEIDTFTKLKEYRNRLTHEMLDVIFDGDYKEFDVYYSKLISLIISFDRWWTLNVEFPTSCVDNKENIDVDKIITGSEMVIKLLTDLVSGDEEIAMEYYNEYLRIKEKQSYVI